MKEYYAGQDIVITRQAKKDGVVIDLTNAVISTTIKDNNSYIISLNSSDENQIKIINAEIGLFNIYINSSYTANLSAGICKIESDITINSNAYIDLHNIYIKNTIEDTYSIYTVDKTTDLTYAQLTARIASDNLIPSQKIKILNFSGITGLIVTAKTVDTLEPLAYLENSNVAYIYDVSSNTITPLSEITESLENKTIDFSDNNVINQIEVTYEQLTALITSNGLKKGNKYSILNQTGTGGDLIVTAKTENTLEPFAYLNPSVDEDNYIYVYDVTTNTIEFLKDITESLQNKTIDCSKNTFENQTLVTYAELTALIAANDGVGALKKGNKYLITDFQETWTGGSKAVEQIIVTASSTNTLERVASSVTNPNDYIEYSTNNNLLGGATKGVILYRKDISSNEYSINCHSITLGYGSYRNKFEIGCYSITLGITSSNNNFGYDCRQTTAGEGCSLNEFGKSCFNNTIGSAFINNKLNNECFSNVFGNSYIRNEFIDCQYRNFTTTYTAFEPYLQGNYYCKVYKLSNSKLCLEYTNIDGQTIREVI